MSPFLRSLVVIALALAAVTLPGAALAAPPPNDDFTAATAISSLPFTDAQNTSEATWAPDDPSACHSNGSVWYALTPGQDGVIVVDTFGSGYDTTLGAYTGSQGALSLVPGACNDDFNGLNSRISFAGSAGTTYYIVAGRCCGGGGNGGGNLVLHVNQIAPPANDAFADAEPITGLPFSQSVDATGATLEANEPTPSCGFGSSLGTAWWAFSPSTSGSYSASAPWIGVDAQVAVYTGGGISSLSQIGCRAFGQLLTFHADVGTTYYLQVGGVFGRTGAVRLDIGEAPDPVANFGHFPGDPSVYDTVGFSDFSHDPAGVGIQSRSWSFGDGTTDSGCCPTHRYAADGTYEVTLTVTTPDGRSASLSRQIEVRTHDVAITKLQVPQSGNVGQTRQVVVGLSNKRYAETVQVQLYKSGPNGFEFVGTLVQSVPVRPGGRTTDVKFSYTFTSSDATLGKVTFKAIASLVSARDALPADNEAVALPTKVNG